MPMAKENLSVTLPLKFRLRRVENEKLSDEERAAIIAGRRAYKRGEFIPLDEWRHAVGLGDH
jgi:hypothetical protein